METTKQFPTPEQMNKDNQNWIENLAIKMNNADTQLIIEALLLTKGLPKLIELDNSTFEQVYEFCCYIDELAECYEQK